MAALRKIMGVRLIDKIRNEDIRTRMHCTRAIVQLASTRDSIDG